MEKKYRFAFVSNSAEIGATVRAFCDPELEEMDICLATMEKAVPIARKLLKEGIEVVLGGGATGRLLRQSLDRPVVTIGRTPLDVLRALIKAREVSKEVVITNFNTTCEGVELYQDLLDINIEQLVFNTTAELVEGIAKKVSGGGKIIVGSGICREISRSLSTDAIIIYPSREVIVRALEEARAIAGAQRKERGDTQRLGAILDCVSEGVISIDAEGLVTLLNNSASKKMGLNPAEIVGKPIAGMLEGMGLLKVLQTGKPDIDQIRRIGREDMVVNSLPVTWEGRIQAVVSSFKPASRIQAIDQKLKKKLFQKGFVARYTLGHLHGSSRTLHKLKEKAEHYAAIDAPILIQGETGTGKELLAQSIHNAGPRRSKPFVAVNCAALPETLLESELFGYEEGAFTGAKRGGKPGLFELANKGTIFLDEIADISMALQVRLLRVIEEGEVMRLGGDSVLPVDVRIVSSTWRDLVQEVLQGHFRSDLYFRLAVLRLQTPALRQRKKDIPLLLGELLQRNGFTVQDTNALLNPEVEARLRAYDWPGNVRELDSLAHRFAALRDSTENRIELLLDLLREIEEAGFNDSMHSNEKSLAVSFSDTGDLKQAVAAFERRVIQQALVRYEGNKHNAAHSLGISVNTLWRKSK